MRNYFIQIEHIINDEFMCKGVINMNEEEKIKQKKHLKECSIIVFKYTSLITVVVLSSWFILMIGKNLSYEYMYEDMVKKTVNEIILEKDSICNNHHNKDEHTHP